MNDLRDIKDCVMLSELFDRERASIDYFFDNIDREKMEELFEILRTRSGMIIVTGVGKSGLVAKKIAATMTSTNSRAIYLSPVDALHGDLGIVTDRDVFLFFSKSGESEELLNLVPSLRNKGVKLVAIVSNPMSRLAKACEFFLHLPVDRELCPYDMVPTISTTVQMIFGDVISIALMEQKKLSLEEYGMNHPAGRIGKRITLRVRDIMITGDQIPLSLPKVKLGNLLVELSNKRCGCMVVVDEERRLQGIFTDGDLRRALQKWNSQALEKSVEELMTKTPRKTTAETLAKKALIVMENSLTNEVMVLPVVDDENRVVGLIKLHDIIQSGI